MFKMECKFCRHLFEIFLVEAFNLSSNHPVPGRSTAWRLFLIQDIPIDHMHKLIAWQCRTINKLFNSGRPYDLVPGCQIMAYVLDLLRGVISRGGDYRRRKGQTFHTRYFQYLPLLTIEMIYLRLDDPPQAPRYIQGKLIQR